MSAFPWSQMSHQRRSPYCFGAVLQSDFVSVWNFLHRVLGWKVEMNIRKQ